MKNFSTALLLLSIAFIITVILLAAYLPSNYIRIEAPSPQPTSTPSHTPVESYLPEQEEA
jgi:hypothetical protein